MGVPARILRTMGLRSDSQGIIDRYIRVNGAWEEHLRNSRHFVLDAISGRKIRNLAVYGSGCLLDLPLDELAGSADHIFLYDLVHPRQILHRLGKYRNVEPIQEDITGGAVMKAYQWVRSYKKDGQMLSPEQLCTPVFQPAVVPDFAVSLNILSQIGELITDYLKLHIPCTPDQIVRINSLLQQSHLQLLEPGRSCLITDVKEINSNLQNNREIESTWLINCPLPPAARTASWDWQFDPLGGYKSGMKTTMQVLAMEI